MAMESAWVLAGLLAGATPDGVPDVLHRYEQAQRPRVEAAQANSRRLARLMFLRSRTLSAVRNTVARFLPLRAALRPIVELLQRQPRPSPTWKARPWSACSARRSPPSRPPWPPTSAVPAAGRWH